MAADARAEAAETGCREEVRTAWGKQCPKSGIKQSSDAGKQCPGSVQAMSRPTAAAPRIVWNQDRASDRSGTRGAKFLLMANFVYALAGAVRPVTNALGIRACAPGLPSLQ